MSTLPVARRPETWLVSLVALFTSCAAYVMDWNVTHIYNPNWPPHAKFHNGQTMSMGLLLGLLGLWFVWRRPPRVVPAVPARVSIAISLICSRGSSNCDPQLSIRDCVDPRR